MFTRSVEHMGHVYSRHLPSKDAAAPERVRLVCRFRMIMWRKQLCVEPRRKSFLSRDYENCFIRKVQDSPSNSGKSQPTLARRSRSRPTTLAGGAFVRIGWSSQRILLTGIEPRYTRSLSSVTGERLRLGNNLTTLICNRRSAQTDHATGLSGI